jgi:hypothetical protein
LPGRKKSSARRLNSLRSENELLVEDSSINAYLRAVHGKVMRDRRELLDGF